MHNSLYEVTPEKVKNLIDDAEYENELYFANAVEVLREKIKNKKHYKFFVFPYKLDEDQLSEKVEMVMKAGFAFQDGDDDFWLKKMKYYHRKNILQSIGKCVDNVKLDGKVFLNSKDMDILTNYRYK